MQNCRNKANGFDWHSPQCKLIDTDHVPSRRRNPIIADVFGRMNYMERRESGFKKIKENYRREAGSQEERYRFFLSDGRYRNAIESEKRGEIKIRSHAVVVSGKLYPGRKRRFGLR